MQHSPDETNSQASANNPSTVPGVRDMLAKLISLPSISSASAEWDLSNEPVVRTLGEWLETLGFLVEVWLCPNSQVSIT